MEPNVLLPPPSPEMGRNRGPEAPRPIENVPEKQSQIEAQESREAQVFSAPTALPPLPVIPDANPVQMPAPVTAQPALQDTPLAAADDDLIEKEWVDKAKKIVLETKDNPYSQEEKVSQLQADYLKKRYGKDIKLSNS
jgi:hypothetical protein